MHNVGNLTLNITNGMIDVRNNQFDLINNRQFPFIRNHETITDKPRTAIDNKDCDSTQSSTENLEDQEEHEKDCENLEDQEEHEKDCENLKDQEEHEKDCENLEDQEEHEKDCENLKDQEEHEKDCENLEDQEEHEKDCENLKDQEEHEKDCENLEDQEEHEKDCDSTQSTSENSEVLSVEEEHEKNCDSTQSASEHSEDEEKYRFSLEICLEQLVENKMVCSTTVLSNSEEICLYHDESGLNVLGCRTIFSRKASKDEGLLDSLPSGVLWMCVSEREYFGVDIQSELWIKLKRSSPASESVPSFLPSRSTPIINHGGEKLMTWPPCSPDLNPIENLWSIIKCEIYKEGKQYTSLNSVWEAVVAAARNPVVKLQNNRGNNKYSYTSNSDDNLLKNIELFDKLVLRFNGRVLFVKDVLGDEICCWSFYGEGRKIAEVCCTSIVYATEKKQTKVEFPEARIFEETLNILIYENNRGSGPGGLHLLDSRGSGSSLGTGQSEEEGDVGGDRRVRRIHVRRHIMHDERGHGQQTVYKD
ncbi:unnamed protein product [Oreochromis niloticus]|nr:unnamed protein product [Mustela putorius furo]